MFGGVRLTAPASPTFRPQRHERKRTVREMLANPRPIGGGDGTDTIDEALTVEGLASTSTESLHGLRSKIVARCEEVAKKAEEGGGFHVLEKPEKDAMRSGVDNLKVLAEVIAEREGDEETLAHVRAAKEADEKRKKGLREMRPPIYGNGPHEVAQREAITPGELFIEDDAYKAWAKKYPEGGPSRGSGPVESDSVPVHHMAKLLGLRSATDDIRSRMGAGARAPVTSVDDSAGSLVRPQFFGLLEPGLTRPLTIRDLVTVIPTSSNAIEYVKEAGRSSNATIVTEADQLADSGDETATKPEGGLTFELVTDTVKTIAEWVAATRQIVADAPQLRAYIDTYLVYDLGLELEDQMIAGDGTGEDFEGILNAGITVLTPPSDDNQVFEQIRKAKTKVRTLGRTNATGVVVHPDDSEYIDLLKVNSEANHFAGPGPFANVENAPIWRLPRIESEAMLKGEALVGDFKRAILFDREAATISVGTVDKDFIRNLVRILAELRAGFGVVRPAAFVRAPLYSGGASSA